MRSPRSLALGSALALLTALLSPAGPAGAAPTYLPADRLSEDPGYLATVVTNPDGLTLAVWESGPFGNEQAQYAVRRPGGDWSEAAPLDTAATDLANSSPNLDAVVDGAGRITVVWTRETLTNTVISTRRLDPRGRWSPRQDLTSPSVESRYPSVSANDAEVTVLWLQGTYPAGSLMTRSRPTQGGWRAVRPITGSGRAQMSEVVTDQAGRQTAVWTQWDGIDPDPDNHRIRTAERASNNAAWGAPAYLDDLGDEAYDFDLAPGGNDVTVIWAGYSPTGVLAARRKRSGGLWRPAVTIGTLPLKVMLEPDRNGGLTAVWESGDPGSPIYARRWSAGAWRATQTIGTNANSHRSSLAVSHTGRAIVQWRDNDDVVMASYRKGATFAPSVVMGETSPGQIQADDVGLDHEDSAIVLWNEAATTELKATVLDAAGPTSTINGPAVARAMSARVRIGWRASDSWSAVAGAKVQLRRTAWNGRPGPRRLVPHQSRRASVAGRPGTSYCFRVASRDAVGNTGDWSAIKCRVLPVDDRQARRSGAWQLTRAAGAWRRTLSTSSQPGAALTLNGSLGRRFLLVARTGPGAGKVSVRVGHRTRVIDLAAPRRRTKVIHMAGLLGIEHRRIVVRVMGRRPVSIDGVYVIR
ncbi:MAG: hypothetical protein Q8O61_05440 [Nocardioides sp.]|nr:hypothetical protein [Nocardioides sp.]